MGRRNARMNRESEHLSEIIEDTPPWTWLYALFAEKLGIPESNYFDSGIFFVIEPAGRVLITLCQ